MKTRLMAAENSTFPSQ